MSTSYPREHSRSLQCRNQTPMVWLGFRQMCRCLHHQGINLANIGSVGSRWQLGYVFYSQLGDGRVVTSSQTSFVLFQSSFNNFIQTYVLPSNLRSCAYVWLQLRCKDSRKKHGEIKRRSFTATQPPTSSNSGKNLITIYVITISSTTTRRSKIYVTHLGSINVHIDEEEMV